MAKPLSFWQFVRERWLKLLAFTLGWAALWIWVVPRFPPWVGLGINGVIWLALAYQIGVIRTQARWMREQERELKRESAEVEAIFREAAEAVRTLGHDRVADILERGVAERRH